MRIFSLLNRIREAGSTAPGHIIGYDTTTRSWRKFTLGSNLTVNGSGVISASGIEAWDAELTVASDILQSADINPEPITDFAVNPLAYGLYEFELRVHFTSTGAFSTLNPFELQGSNSGDAFPNFVSREYFGIWDNSRGDEWTGSGGSSQSDPFTQNTATDATAREFEAYARGKFYHFDYNDGFFGQNFNPVFQASSGNTNGVTLKAGSTFKYKKLADTLITSV